MTVELQGPPAASAPAGRKGSRCCLWSCGCLLLALVLLAAAGWVVYRQYASPWVETQKTRLVERFPAVGSLLRLGEIKDSLLQDKMISGGEVGSKAREDFPADVFFPEGHTRATFNTTAQTALAAFVYPDVEPPKLVGEVRAEMERLGWRRVPVDDPADGVRLRFDSDARSAVYEIFRSVTGARVWINVTRAAAAAPEGN